MTAFRPCGLLQGRFFADDMMTPTGLFVPESIGICDAHHPAQAGGVSPPFTVCVHSWFEVFGVRREGKGVGRRWEGASGMGRGERER